MAAAKVMRFVSMVFATTAFAFAFVAAAEEAISNNITDDVRNEDDDWKIQLDSVIDRKHVDAREHLRLGRAANPSKEGRLSGKKLLGEYPNYVNMIYTPTTTILVCSDIRCNGIPTVDEDIPTADEDIIPGIADPLKPVVTVGDTVAPGDGIFNNCPNRDECSCTDEGDPYDYDSMNGFYCKWTGATPLTEDADFPDPDDSDDNKTVVGEGEYSKV